MGRTARTFRNAVDSEEARWKNFRRTLRPARRERLDQIFDYARKYADAGTMMVTPRVTEVVFISSLMEMLSEIESLRETIARLENAIEENPS